MTLFRPAFSLGLALTFFVPSPASAYQIDCAILLCLAGGFPPSVPCAQARAEMIRRITPWPIEPPLQIWRCPMHAAFDLPAPERPAEQLYRIASLSAQTTRSSEQLVPQEDFSNAPVSVAAGDYTEGTGTADADISGPEFDFVRSIRVFSVEYARQRWSGGDNDTCIQKQRVRLGTYGTQGDFNWRASSVTALPSAFDGLEGWADFRNPDGRHCPGLDKRSVFVEWHDHEGGYGFEQVDY